MTVCGVRAEQAVADARGATPILNKELWLTGLALRHRGTGETVGYTAVVGYALAAFQRIPRLTKFATDSIQANLASRVQTT